MSLVGDLPAVGNLRHEGVLEAGGETGTTATAKSRVFDFLDDPVLAHTENLLGVVPVATLERAVNPGRFILVQVGEDTVLVG